MSGAANVMITSAGRRTTLLQRFAQACHQRGGKVFAADLSSLAPALYFADGIVRVPPVRDPDYVPVLAAAAREHGIRAVVPTIDPELPLFSSRAEEFNAAGCIPLVSTADFSRITGDKWHTVRAFAQQGIDVPQSWLPEELDDASRAALPAMLYIKPRDGSASQNVFRIRREELADYAARVPNPIVQEELTGEEITIDALLSADGTPLHYVPRRRIRTLAGESIVGVTIGGAEIESWCERALRACSALGARWAITLQAFLTPRGIVLTEINARFGGGAPLAFAAGGNYPETVLRLLESEPVLPTLGDYKRGLYFMRYMTEVFTEMPVWPV